MSDVSGATTPHPALRQRDARGRFVARASLAALPRQARPLPSRDSRGRFVAFPTTPAPSWYVFCAAGYRILSDDLTAVSAVPPIVPTEMLPRAIARRRGPRFTRSELKMAIALLIFLTLIFWYVLHLPRPQSSW